MRFSVKDTCDAVYNRTKMKYPSTIKVAYLVERPSCREYGYDVLKRFLCRLTRFGTVHRFSVLLKKQKPDLNPLTE